LIDPVKALPGLEKLASGNSDAFLMHKDGKVLAHTLSAYVGTNLKKLGSLKEGISNLFLGAQTGGVQRYIQSDGTREVLALVRAGVFPFAIGVEQKAPAAILSSDWILDQMDSGAARKGVGVAFVLIAIAMTLFSILSAWASRSVRLEISRFKNREGSTSDQAPTLGARSEPDTGLSAATENFVNARNQVNQAREESSGAARFFSEAQDELARFTGRIEGALTLEAVEKELVDFSTELTGGKVIYFRYQRRMQITGVKIFFNRVFTKT
jgi:hypothetical protein